MNGPITIIADTDSERLSIVKAVIGDFAETFDVSTPETRNQMYQRVITLLLAHEADINVVVSDDEALMAFVHHMANTVKGRVGQIITLGDTKKPASIQHK
ncbi:MAG TPA: hypothetical protein PK765_03225 [bacterium]|nr:hypothetical protein [bacterium]